MLQALHSYTSTDSTKALNDSIKDILPAGVYFGGDLSPAGTLIVGVSAFAAKSLDGMTVRNEVQTVINIPHGGAADDIYRVGIMAVYQPLTTPILTPMAIKETLFGSTPNKEFFICFGTCDLTAGTVVTIPTLSNTNRTVPNFPLFGGFGSGGIIFTSANEYLLGLLMSGYDYLAVDLFDDEDQIFTSNMVYDGTGQKYVATAAGQEIISKNMISPEYPLATNVTEVLVSVDTDDPFPIIQVRSNMSLSWETVANYTNHVISTPGTALQIRIESSLANKSYYSYGVMYFPSVNQPAI